MLSGSWRHALGGTNGRPYCKSVYLKTAFSDVSLGLYLEAQNIDKQRALRSEHSLTKGFMLFNGTAWANEKTTLTWLNMNL